MLCHFRHLLLPLLLFDATVNAGIRLPVFTASDKTIRPAEVGKVKAQASCNSLIEQDFSCGKDVKWDKWGQPKGDGTLEMHKVDVDVGCNHDSTFSGNADQVTGASCLAVVSCSTPECNDLVPNNSKKIYNYLDPQCFIETKNGDKFQSRWGNHEPSMKKLATATPEGAVVTTGDIYVIMPTLDQTHGNGGIGANTKRFLGHRLWNSALADTNVAERFKCKDGCQYGTHIEVVYHKTEKGMHLFLDSKCDWFTVCTAWRGDGNCPYQSSINVMLKAGFVSFDSRHEQMPIRLMRKAKDGKGLVRVDLSLFAGKKVGDKYSKAAITSMFRQRVVGTVNLDTKMLITFDKPDCINEKFGLRAQTDQVSVLFLKNDTKEYKDAVRAKNTETIDNADCQQTQIDGDAPLTPPTDPPTGTTENIDRAGEETTTTAPPRPPSMGSGVPVIVDPYATKAKRTGHATWAIFYGWLLGSAVAFLVMAPIMYFCRRSLYNDWYRGMFKRYGCDASGTTGGVTGAEFGDATTSANSVMTMQSQMEMSTRTQQETTTGGVSSASSIGTSVRSVKSEAGTMVTM